MPENMVHNYIATSLILQMTVLDQCQNAGITSDLEIFPCHAIPPDFLKLSQQNIHHIITQMIFKGRMSCFTYVKVKIL